MKVMDVPGVLDRTSDGTGCGDVCQVVIYNDNHNTCEHVLMCLMSVFGHSSGLAEKIMMEAHMKGKSIAQVEGFEEAVKHVMELKSLGIGADIQGISVGI